MKRIAILSPYVYPQSGACAHRMFYYSKMLQGNHIVSVYKLGSFRDAYTFLNFIRKYVDVLICTVPSFYGLVVAILFKFLHRNTLLMVDVRDNLTTSEGIKYHFFLALLYISQRLSSLFIFTSEYQINSFSKKQKIVANTEIIANGWDASARSFSQCPVHYSFVFSGTVVPERNAELLVQLVKRLDSLNFSILFIGIDLNNPYTKEFVKNTLLLRQNTSIYFLPQLNPLLVKKYVSHANFGVVSLSQNSEYLYQIPAKLIEYLGYNVQPVLIGATDNSASKSFLDNLSIPYLTYEAINQNTKAYVFSSKDKQRISEFSRYNQMKKILKHVG